MTAPRLPDNFQDTLSAVMGADVSRETLDTLQLYVDNVAAAAKVHNLMGPKELPRIWERHILDSAQLYPHLCRAHGIMDLGTGAGFPGVVLALLGLGPLHLVESTQKKCTFLKHVSRETSVPLHIHSLRCEDLTEAPVTHITSRAMAPLSQILVWAQQWVKPHHVFVLLKGAQALAEIQAAQKVARFQVETHPSCTNPEGHIVVLKNILFSKG